VTNATVAENQREKMKKNTTDTKRMIQQALNQMPDDFALSEARFHLKAALGHLEHVEQKRQKREVQQRQNEIQARFNSMGQLSGNPINLKESLKAIDDMIAQEQKKLDDIASKRQSRNTPQEIEPLEDDLIRD
jgi:cysteinyl-tRNA synthetase